MRKGKQLTGRYFLLVYTQMLYGNGSEMDQPQRGGEIYHFKGSAIGTSLAEAISDANFPQIGIQNRGIKNNGEFICNKKIPIYQQY